MRQLVAAVLFLAPLAAAQKTATVWPVDSLVKLRPDASPADSRAPKTDWLIARNGHASLQFAIRSATPIQALNVEAALPQPLTVQVRRVGYVPIHANPPDSPASALIASAPGQFPDPLLEDLPFDVPANQTTSIWLTVYAPAGATPGIYRGLAKFRTGGKRVADFPFQVRVVEATVPERQTLQVTNWLNTDGSFDPYYGPDKYWEVMTNLARVLGEHRQNVILTPVLQLTDASVQNGTVTYDFTRLDRWVGIFDQAGVSRLIEGGHLLGRQSGYNSPLTVPAFVVENGAVQRKSLDPADPRAEAHLRSYLPALYAHLQQKGWTSRYVQHVLDEAHGTEPPVYLRYVGIIRQVLPGIQTIDAIDQTAGLLGEACDIWVPQLGRFNDGLDSIRQHVQSGKQAWFYTCLYPQGTYLNRFIQQPVLKTRLLHWLNYQYGFTGFLHWGGNYWTDDPFKSVEASIPSGDGKMELLPAGDAFIVYPWREKNSVHSSIRLEAMREGIEDYELLVELGKKDPAKAKALAVQVIPSLSESMQDVKAFRRVHAALLGVGNAAN